jgi:predicted phosphodiesterase
VLADTHIEDGNAFGLEKIKDVIQGNNVKFVVIAGDITQNGSRKDVQKFINIARSFDVPCYPVIGNHDVYFSNWSVWKKFIGSTCYRVNGENATLFILDSADGYFGKEQLDWLQSGLKKTARRVFVFTHANLFAESPADIQQLTDTNERARIISLLSGHCDAMFTGHLHKRIVKKAGDVEYISVEDFKEKQKYCLVSVKPSGVSYTFKKL